MIAHAKLKIDRVACGWAPDCNWMDVEFCHRPRSDYKRIKIKHHKRWTHVIYEFKTKKDMKDYMARFKFTGNVEEYNL